jgi:IS5 family transposase
MIGKTDKNPQLNVFCIPLVNVINIKHELVELAQRINWKSVERDFAPYYGDVGRPAVPERKMVGCMLQKQMFGWSDEAFVDRWVENIYWQYFCDKTYVQAVL